jgi:Streptomyces sporulation and cell division protein, SsgA
MRHRIRMLAKAGVEAPDDIAGIIMPVLFDYNPSDPLAVSLTFGWNREDGVVWVIGRDLLRDGLDEIAGTGDATAWTESEDPGSYYLRLRTGNSCTVFKLETRMIEVFLAQAYASIPAGAELPAGALDAELNAIFGQAA